MGKLIVAATENEVEDVKAAGTETCPGGYKVKTLNREEQYDKAYRLLEE